MGDEPTCSRSPASDQPRSRQPSVALAILVGPRASSAADPSASTCSNLGPGPGLGWGEGLGQGRIRAGLGLGFGLGLGLG